MTSNVNSDAVQQSQMDELSVVANRGGHVTHVMLPVLVFRRLISMPSAMTAVDGFGDIADTVVAGFENGEGRRDDVGNAQDGLQDIGTTSLQQAAAATASGGPTISTSVPMLPPGLVFGTAASCDVFAAPLSPDTTALTSGNMSALAPERPISFASAVAFESEEAFASVLPSSLASADATVVGSTPAAAFETVATTVFGTASTPTISPAFVSGRVPVGSPGNVYRFDFVDASVTGEVGGVAVGQMNEFTNGVRAYLEVDLRNDEEYEGLGGLGGRFSNGVPDGFADGVASEVVHGFGHDPATRQADVFVEGAATDLAEGFAVGVVDDLASGFAVGALTVSGNGHALSKDELHAVLKYGAQKIFDKDDSQQSKKLDEMDLDDVYRSVELHETVAAQNEGAVDTSRHDFVNNLGNGFAKDFVAGFANGLPMGFANDLPASFANDFPASFANDFPASFANDLPASFANDLPASFANELSTSFAYEFSTSFATGVSTGFATELSTGFANDLAVEFAPDLATGSATDPAGIFASNLENGVRDGAAVGLAGDVIDRLGDGFTGVFANGLADDIVTSQIDSQATYQMNSQVDVLGSGLVTEGDRVQSERVGPCRSVPQACYHCYACKIACNDVLPCNACLRKGLTCFARTDEEGFGSKDKGKSREQTTTMTSDNGIRQDGMVHGTRVDWQAVNTFLEEVYYGDSTL